MGEYKAIRAIISGGGTGGHIFPAVSIAGKLKEVNPESEILFVGAEGRMEMEKVPAAGFRIEGLPITGIQRQLTLHNLLENIKVPFRILRSVRKAGKLLDSFKPDIAIGVGGYASAPLLYAAQKKGIPTLIQEQNGFAGLTNKILGRKADRICVAYEGMERFFPADRIVMSGNPIRESIRPATQQEKDEGIGFFGFSKDKKHILIVGGSLGSRTLNEAVKSWIESGCPGSEGIEVLWQCGKYYKASIDAFMEGRDCPGIRYSDFISRMDLAYAMADIVISRSGASSVSEICAMGKAAIFVPSPNVAEDHQTHNAKALSGRNAALLVKDSEAGRDLMKTAVELLGQKEKIDELGCNALKMALPEASMTIVEEIYSILKENPKH